jgi:outer membrane protein TolC
MAARCGKKQEMGMRKNWSLAPVLLLALPRAAFAGPPAGSPAAAATALPALDPSSIPPLPHVEDPMLAPLPPPKRVVSSWAEAQQMLRTRSTNLKTALDQVVAAEGQTMVAFAQYLPALGGCAGGSSAPPGCGNATYSHQLLTRRQSEDVAGEPLSSTLPIPNTVSGSLTLSQDIINVQEFD